MTTPAATPVLTSDDIPVQEAKPARHRTRIVRSLAGTAGDARVESSIQHAAKEAGFDENS